MVYATGDGASTRWEPYVGPIDLPEGVTTARGRAIRYGYAGSDERRATFVVD